MKQVTLVKRERLGKGAEAECFVWSRKRVLKAYETRREARAAFDRHKATWVVDLAPPVYYMVKVNDRRAGVGRSPRRKKFGYVCGRAGKTRQSLTQAQRNLIEKTLKYSTDDLYGRNLGEWDGKVVVVDFGDLSCKE